MKIAIVLCGNLRTFFMPIEKNSNIRLCDHFVNNIVFNNNADVFVFTDVNDFYYNDVQYFTEDRCVEILNNDTSRLHKNIDFIDYHQAKNIIINQFSIMGNNLKSYYIDNKYEATNDVKFTKLNDANCLGNNPILLIQQLRKMKLAYELVKEYELSNNFKYDIILKWRFDNTANEKFDLKSYNYLENDIYVPGIHSPIIYDWFAHGNRNAMDSYLSLYDFLGEFLSDGHIYICSNCSYYGNANHVCHGSNQLFEITLSVEYHLFRVFNMKKIKLHNSIYPSCPHRYRNNTDGISINEIMNNLNVDATVINYSAGIEITKKPYTQNEKK